MTLDPAAVSALITRLNALHCELRSWRKVAKQYPGVMFGTLQRIAGGGYVPKDRKILRALGLLEVREPTEHERRTKKAIRQLVKDTNDSVVRRKP